LAKLGRQDAVMSQRPSDLWTVVELTKDRERFLVGRGCLPVVSLAQREVSGRFESGGATPPACHHALKQAPQPATALVPVAGCRPVPAAKHLRDSRPQLRRVSVGQAPTERGPDVVVLIVDPIGPGCLERAIGLVAIALHQVQAPGQMALADLGGLPA